MVDKYKVLPFAAVCVLNENDRLIIFMLTHVLLSLESCNRIGFVTLAF